jgi:putative hydrolases of HD superfamily
MPSCSTQAPDHGWVLGCCNTWLLLQAVEYRDIGVRRVDGWIESARKDLTTETARRFADAAVHVSVLSWRDR